MTREWMSIEGVHEGLDRRLWLRLAFMAELGVQ